MILRYKISHILSHLSITFIPRACLGKLTKGQNMIQKLSHTPIKSSAGQGKNMIRVCFVCHGNICRSTMSQFVFQDMINKQGLSDQFYIDSAATSREEIGNGPHYGTVAKCREMGIPVLPHKAVQMTKKDYQKYDYLIGMDTWNIRNMTRIAGGDPDRKIYKLLEFADLSEDIADPWYTGNFDETYADVQKGCIAFLEYLKRNGKIR